MDTPDEVRKKQSELVRYINTKIELVKKAPPPPSEEATVLDVAKQLGALEARLEVIRARRVT